MVTDVLDRATPFGKCRHLTTLEGWCLSRDRLSSGSDEVKKIQGLVRDVVAIQSASEHFIQPPVSPIFWRSNYVGVQTTKPVSLLEHGGTFANAARSDAMLLMTQMSHLPSSSEKPWTRETHGIVRLKFLETTRSNVEVWIRQRWSSSPKKSWWR